MNYIFIIMLKAIYYSQKDFFLCWTVKRFMSKYRLMGRMSSNNLVGFVRDKKNEITINNVTT